ncbi:hypothetical protein OSB04_002315 [Centaurea solstitialis]|uniref:Uncharacterized protein n=1 Tax=Centaurea solstitialis TaxID=347529 RepID=A0AA38TUH9_9ASTR|nr:hypothetical protein OSB04_002315 [Centaurea solstitialis]
MKIKRHTDHLERLGCPVLLQLATNTILNSLLKTIELSMGTKTKDVLMVKNGEVRKKCGHGNTSKGKGQVLATLSAPRVNNNGKGKSKGKKVKSNRVMTKIQYFKCHEVGYWRHNCPKHYEACINTSECNMDYTKINHQAKSFNKATNLTRRLKFNNKTSEELASDEWGEENIVNLVKLLRCFYEVSDLKVNLNKCNIFGIRVPEEEVLGWASGSLPFTYLGLPVGVSMKRVSHWEKVITKFKNKLSGWKAKWLSFGGRLTLVKSVLSSMPLYYFSLFHAPVNVVKSLERVRRDFFGGMFGR